MMFKTILPTAVQFNVGWFHLDRGLNRFIHLAAELGLVQAGIETVLCEEFSMCPAFDNPPAIHHQD